MTTTAAVMGDLESVLMSKDGKDGRRVAQLLEDGGCGKRV